VKAVRREYVPLLAVRVLQQRDVGRAVRVVFDRGHPGRHAVLVALEIDDAVFLPVAAAMMADGDAPVYVAARRLLLGSSSDFSGVVQVISSNAETVMPRRPGEVGL
jgi:hypothetical protein